MTKFLRIFCIIFVAIMISCSLSGCLLLDFRNAVRNYHAPASEDKVNSMFAYSPSNNSDAQNQENVDGTTEDSVEIE